MHEMLIGLPPFYDSKDTQKMFKSILYDNVELPSSLSIDARKLLKRLLHKDPDKRPNIDDLLLDPWL